VPFLFPVESFRRSRFDLELQSVPFLFPVESFRRSRCGLELQPFLAEEGEKVANDNRLRLRAPPLGCPFRIVLVEPEIPQNTGNIGRLAVATGSTLHLVGRLGFRIDEKSVRRAGLDYWRRVKLEQHPDLAHFRASYPGARLRLFSAKARRSYITARFSLGDAIVFGRESVGLDPELLVRQEEDVLAIPTLGQVRSLNLANAVAIVLYEALRQVGALTNPALEV
jgi:tRNA (cytidine/uridine-2'-O-)-methyltransferase